MHRLFELELPLQTACRLALGIRRRPGGDLLERENKSKNPAIATVSLLNLIRCIVAQHLIVVRARKAARSASLQPGAHALAQEGGVFNDQDAHVEKGMPFFAPLRLPSMKKA